jgi:hypothetical protein
VASPPRPPSPKAAVWNSRKTLAALVEEQVKKRAPSPLADLACLGCLDCSRAFQKRDSPNEEPLVGSSCTQAITSLRQGLVTEVGDVCPTCYSNWNRSETYRDLLPYLNPPSHLRCPAPRRQLPNQENNQNSMGYLGSMHTRILPGCCMTAACYMASRSPLTGLRTRLSGCYAERCFLGRTY